MSLKGSIIYIGGFELPNKNAAAQRVLANAPIFRELGYDVVFIGTTKEQIGTGLDNRKEVRGFDHYCVPYPDSIFSWLSYLVNINLFKDVVKTYGDVKAVICYNYQAGAFMRIKRYCDKNKIKVIGDTTEWYSPQGSIIFKTIKNIDTYLRMHVIQPKLDGLIPTSEYLYNFYKHKNNNLLILPTLVDLNDEKWNVEIEEYEDNKIRLIYAGSTGIGKDELAKTLDILSKVKENSNCDFELKIIGMTFDQYCKAFCVDEVPNIIKNNTIFTGRIPHEQVIKEVTNSDFFIFIRDVSIVTSAGFPTKFSESISCGTPVITTKTSDLETYLIEGENGYFIDINNGTETIEKMIKIFNLDKKTIKKMKEACRESRLMDYRNYLNRTSEFFKKVGL